MPCLRTYILTPAGSPATGSSSLPLNLQFSSKFSCYTIVRPASEPTIQLLQQIMRQLQQQLQPRTECLPRYVTVAATLVPWLHCSSCSWMGQQSASDAAASRILATSTSGVSSVISGSCLLVTESDSYRGTYH
jgi:hypothetical protein